MTFATSIQIQSSVAEETARFLRRSGKRETVVYWAGLDCGERWVVTTALCPRQCITRGSFTVDAAANAKVVQDLNAHQLVMLGQVHSHPGEFVGHSEGDDEWTSFAFPGFISIVVPTYCRNGLLPLSQCGVHRYEDHFRQLNAAEVSRLFSLTPVSLDHHATRFSFFC